VKELAAYLEGDRSMVPPNKLQIIPTKVIDKSNVKEFAESIRKMLKK
jgi:ribose transport system substrate-binding protein